MGQDQGSAAYRSGVFVVGECKNHRRGAGHVMVVQVNSLNEEEEESIYSILREEKGVCFDEVRDVVPIEDSVVALCSSVSGGLFLFDYANNKIIHSFPESISRATFLPSKSLLISKENESHQIQLYRINSEDNFRNSSHISSFDSGHTKPIFSLFSNDSIHPNHVFSGSSDKTVRIHDLKTEQTISGLDRHTGGFVSAITCNPMDGNIIVSGCYSSSQSVDFWDFRLNECIQSLDIDSIFSLLWTKFKPNLVLIGTRRTGIQVFDIRNLNQNSSDSSLMQLETGAMRHYLTSFDENRFGVSSSKTSDSESHGKCIVFDYNSSGEMLFETNLFGNSQGCCYCPPFEDVSSLNLEQRAAKYFVPADKVTRSNLIGGGGQGKVYKGSFAISPISSIDVAIKRFVVSRNLTDEQRKQGKICAADDLEHEIKLMTELNHVNVLKCHGCFFDEDEFSPDAPTVNVILEWCGDGDLEHWLKQHRRQLTMLDKLDVYLQIAKGLLHIHENGIVHSDVALDNVLVTSQTIDGMIRWIMKVCDFGLSNHFGSLVSAADVGKPRYMPPSRSGSDKTKVDVYSFGILGYEIWLNGKHAYSQEYRDWGMGLTPMERLYRIRHFGLRPNLRECEGMPTALKDILLTVCWSENPDDRPSFDQIVSDVEEIIRNPVVEEEEEGETSIAAPTAAIETWTVDQVSQHFIRLFGEAVGRILSENGIDGSQIFDLSGRQLRRMGIEDALVLKGMVNEILRLDENGI